MLSNTLQNKAQENDVLDGMKAANFNIEERKEEFISKETLE